MGWLRLPVSLDRGRCNEVGRQVEPFETGTVFSGVALSSHCPSAVRTRHINITVG